jgi:hypothetical protein
VGVEIVRSCAPSLLYAAVLRATFHSPTVVALDWSDCGCLQRFASRRQLQLGYNNVLTTIRRSTMGQLTKHCAPVRPQRVLCCNICKKGHMAQVRDRVVCEEKLMLLCPCICLQTIFCIIRLNDCIVEQCFT